MTNKYKFISKSKPAEPFIKSGYRQMSVTSSDFSVTVKLNKKNGIYVHRDLVFALLGCEWPKYGAGGAEFNWDAVSHFQIWDGELVPCDSSGEFIPAPNLKLVMSDLELMW